MTGAYSPDQFKYLVEDPGNIDMQVRAFHPETESEIGTLTVRARHFGMGKPRLRAEPQIKGAFVHPDYQRLGVGTELYDIAAHHLGRPLTHDTSVTEVAQKWAAKVGGSLDPTMKTGEALSDFELRKGFETYRTEKYSQHLAAGLQTPKPRQLAFRGM